MKYMALAFIGAGIVAGSTVDAAELAGGSIKLEYSAFTEDTDVSRLGLEGSLELAFDRNISIQGDLGYQSFDLSGLDSNVFGLHGIYHLDEDSSVGVYYTKDDSDIGDANIFGIEAGHEMGGVEFETYLGRVDTEAFDAVMFGVSGRYEFENALGLTGSFDRVDEDIVDANRFTVKLDRDVAPNVNLFAEVGTGDIKVFGLSESDTFVALGGKISFGASRGATFEQRSLSRLIPGL